MRFFARSPRIATAVLLSGLSFSLAGCASLANRKASDGNATYSAMDESTTPANRLTPAQKDQRLLELETTNQTLLAKIENLEARLRAAEGRHDLSQKTATPLILKTDELRDVTLPGSGGGGEVSDSVIQDYRRAKALFDVRKYPEAILGFSSFVERFPAHVLAGFAQFYLAESYFHQTEYALSEQEYYHAIANFPRSPLVSFAYQRLGLALRKQGKPREADAAESQVEALFPGSPAAFEVSRQKNVAPDTGNAPAEVPPTVDQVPSEKT